MQIAQIRQWVEQAKANRVDGVGYPAELRAVVARHATARRQQGKTWASIQSEVGISRTSIRHWMDEGQRGGFRQLQVVDDSIEPAGAELVFTSPGGSMVTGCTIEEIARLLVVTG